MGGGNAGQAVRLPGFSVRSIGAIGSGGTVRPPAPLRVPASEDGAGSKEVSSFGASTSVERGDFGVGVGSWAATMVVGGDVEIEILLEAHRR